MPSYKSNCFVCDTTFEWSSPTMTDADPMCPECGGPTDRGYFPVASVWLRPICEYGNRNTEGFAAQQKAGGHFAMEKNDEGKVSRTFIATEQDQKSYCKRNGLLNPRELPSNLAVNADGRSYQTVNKCEI